MVGSVGIWELRDMGAGVARVEKLSYVAMPAKMNVAFMVTSVAAI